MVSVALGAFREGCVGETLAAIDAYEAAAGQDDPRVAKVHRVIAEDETEHAAFSWRVVAWLLARDDGRVRRALEAEVAALMWHRDRAIVEVVLPAARALLRGAPNLHNCGAQPARGQGAATTESLS